MGRSKSTYLSLGFAVVLSSLHSGSCSGQTAPNSNVPPAQSGLPNNGLQTQTGLPTIGLPARPLLRTGLIQLQPPAPVITTPIVQLVYRVPPVIVPPVIVNPVINAAASVIPAAPVIVPPFINEPLPEPPATGTAITPQMFGLLTLPMLPASIPGQPAPMGPTILADLTKPQTGTTAGPGGAPQTPGFGPLNLLDLSKQNPTASDAIRPVLKNVLLPFPLLTYDLLWQIHSKATPSKTTSPAGAPKQLPQPAAPLLR